MRLLPALVVLLTAAPFAAAHAAPEPSGLAAAFGNTVKALYPDGKYQHMWFRADGGWEAVGRRGKFSAGRWSVSDRKVCLKQTRPFPAPFRYCTEFPSTGGVGAVWTSRDWQGEPIRLTVVKGIERPAKVP